MKIIRKNNVTNRYLSLTPNVEMQKVSLSYRSIEMVDLYGDGTKTYRIIFDTLEEMEEFATKILEKVQYST